MQALIIDSDSRRLEQAQIAFLEVGMQVTGCQRPSVAETCLGHSRVDVLLIEKRAVGGRLIELVELGESRNPNLVCMLLTPDVSADTERFHDVCAPLHCLLDENVSMKLAARVALSSLMQGAGLSLPVRVSASTEASDAGAAVLQGDGIVPVFHSARCRAGPALVAH